jgi:hypothetical protein
VQVGGLSWPQSIRKATLSILTGVEGVSFRHGLATVYTKRPKAGFQALQKQAGIGIGDKVCKGPHHIISYHYLPAFIHPIKQRQSK